MTGRQRLRERFSKFCVFPLLGPEFPAGPDFRAVSARGRRAQDPGLHTFPWVGWLKCSELTGFLGWWVGVSVSSLIDP